MAIVRIAGSCEDETTCPGVWVDDQNPGEMIVVGMAMPTSPVPLGEGEIAVRLSRDIVRDAGAQA